METPLVFFQLNHLHTIRIIWLLIAKCPRKPSGIFFRWNQFYLISFLQNIWIHLLYETFCMDQNYIDKNSFVQTYANITKGKCRYEICSYTTFSIFKMKRSKSQFVFFFRSNFSTTDCYIFIVIDLRMNLRSFGYKHVVTSCRHERLKRIEAYIAQHKFVITVYWLM